MGLAGCATAAWDDNGKPILGEVGELVVTAPMPSMPLYLWNDPDGARYRDSYFDTWPGVWRHGDWITAHSDGSVVILPKIPISSLKGIVPGYPDHPASLDDMQAAIEAGATQGFRKQG